MEAFPCPLERTVAEALLLLATSESKSPSLASNSSIPSCFHYYPSFHNYSINGNDDSSPSDSKSCSSSLTSEGSSKETRPCPLRLLAVAARCNEMKLKVVRKSRSKNFRNLNNRKNLSDLWRKLIILAPVPRSSKTTTEEASSLSTSSSGVSGSPSRCLVGAVRKVKDSVSHAHGEALKRQKVSGTASMRRRAESILKLLSVGCSSEVKIRRVLGDSPDTSKALRMLLKMEEVKRSGTGGRMDPFMYTVTGSRSDVDSV
ncbi:uncharacterized protein LOC122643981 [Telopea speciosissima]|uniref:uncharacterized protein LOC122643981 n=1 Tax=Telopea speciosissima TaxID=54955 RepID=UPI001CC7A165|nr:uncharacterized protein LOC122643981 [Telopea speciosissima]